MGVTRLPSFAAALLAVPILCATSVRADGDAPAPAPASPFHVQLGIDWTTAYFYRGIIQEDDGLILQPSARLTVDLADRGDFGVDAIFGAWNSFHDEKTGAATRGEFTDAWYECDLSAGLAFTLGRLSLTATYTFLTSPNDGFETVQELGFLLAYDDAPQAESSYEAWSGAAGGLAFNPYALVSIETGADASDGADSRRGTYLEVGVAPSFDLPLGANAVSISFPLAVGLSLDDYYQDASGEDDAIGYVQLGAKASVPLNDGASSAGAWTLTAGVAALFLGDNASEYNGGDDVEIVATAGVQLAF